METSSFAYAHVLKTLRQHRPSAGAMGEATVGSDSRSHKAGIYGPLLWLYRLIMRFTVGEALVAPASRVSSEAWAAKYDRSTRRAIKTGKLGLLDARKVIKGLYIEKLMFGGLSPRHRQEKRALISTHGRVKIYGLRYWGTRSQERAVLSCVDHGWWRMPQSSAVNEGLWDVQLPPN